MKRILVVDDEPVIRQLVELSLAGDDCSVVGAPDGLTALQSINDETPDLILLDVGLPGIDGGELARLLRSNDDTARIPIVYLTGLARPQAPDVDGVLLKPFTPSMLRASTACFL